ARDGVLPPDQRQRDDQPGPLRHNLLYPDGLPRLPRLHGPRRADDPRRCGAGGLVQGDAFGRAHRRLIVLGLRGCGLDRLLLDRLPLGARMTTWQALTSLWDWEPSVVLGCTALIAVYVAATRRQPSRAIAPFAAGVLVLLVAQCSPLDVLGDTYLFSAHMLQH